MTHSDPSRDFRDFHDSQDPATADHSRQDEPSGDGRPPAKRARETRREVFEKYHFNGLDGGANDPEIYPEYRPDGPPGACCEACGRAKAVCQC